MFENFSAWRFFDSSKPIQAIFSHLFHFLKCWKKIILTFSFFCNYCYIWGPFLLMAAGSGLVGLFCKSGTEISKIKTSFLSFICSFFHLVNIWIFFRLFLFLLRQEEFFWAESLIFSVCLTPIIGSMLKRHFSVNQFNSD